jgi:gamma-glutamyltranspeptidase/glutathione hydrolase
MPARLARAAAFVAALASSFSLSFAASVAPVPAEHGMVVTAQHLATQVGVDVLRKGGNAVDAAVAVGYALAVVYPAAGNLGGGGFATLRFADGRSTFIDFRERAPRAASRDMYLDGNGNVVKGATTKGYLAAGVPGSVAGFELLRDKYGTMKRAQLIAPAIAFAEKGFVLEQGDADMFVDATGDFRKDPASAAIFLRKGGTPYVAGDRLVQKDLAQTLRRIARLGRDGFYQGPVAQSIERASKAGGGIMTAADLAAYKPREMAPVECDYRGYHVISAPPPSSGGAIVCEILNIVEGYPLGDLGFHGAQAMHYQIEAMRHAYMDRNSYLGDPDYVKNPLDRLLDKKYAEAIRATIDPDHAMASKDLKPGVAPHEGTSTTHFSIVDKDGNAVAVTYSLNDWFGARVTPAGTGVLLNDTMDDFTAKPGVANIYGLVQGQANSIAPGKTPLSSMSPTIVTKDGKVFMVLGTPGGSRIITVVALTIINVVDYGMNIQEAVDAPRFHQQWLPDVTNVERFAVSPDTEKLLVAKGQKLGAPQPANHVSAIIVGAPAAGAKPVGNNRLYGANDPRRNTGLAAGY